MSLENLRDNIMRIQQLTEQFQYIPISIVNTLDCTKISRRNYLVFFLSQSFFQLFTIKKSTSFFVECYLLRYI